MTNDEHVREWNPTALAAFEASHERLVEALVAFGDGVRALSDGGGGPGLGELREAVDRALGHFDSAASSTVSTGYFGTVDRIDPRRPLDALDPATPLGALDGIDRIERVDRIDRIDRIDPSDAIGVVAGGVEPGSFPGAPAPEDQDEAGLGVAILWRLDVRLEDPHRVVERARRLFRETFATSTDAAAARVGSAMNALQVISEIAGMDELMRTDGAQPLGGIRAFVVTEDLLDGPDAIDPLVETGAAEESDDLPWDRTRGVLFLPASGQVVETEGWDFS